MAVEVPTTENPQPDFACGCVSKEPFKEPGFFEGSAKTIAFDLGRRMIRWAIPNARIILMPTEAELESFGAAAGGGTGAAAESDEDATAEDKSGGVDEKGYA